MRRGFTLIEILVVLAISSLLLGLVMTGQREFSRRKTVENVAATILSDLRQAQSQAVSGVEPSTWRCTQDERRLQGYSIAFSSTGYTVSAVCTNASGVADYIQINSYTYPDGVQVRSYPSSPILFKSVGQGTDLSTPQSLAICAFNYGQEITINVKGDIRTQNYTCS